MSEKTITTFPGGKIDVAWDGRLCIHVAECGQARYQATRGRTVDGLGQRHAARRQRARRLARQQRGAVSLWCLEEQAVLRRQPQGRRLQDGVKVEKST